MNIFLRELRAGKKSLIIWSVCMILLVASGMAKYTAYSGAGQSMTELLSKIPYSLRVLLGMSGFDMTTVMGFYAMLYVYLLPAAAIHAVLAGAGAIAAEERDKTAEFLFTRPVSRLSAVTQKLLYALTAAIVLNLVTLFSSLGMVAHYNTTADASGAILRLMTAMFLNQLIFLSLGAAVAALMRRPRSAGALSSGILLAAFVFAKFIDLIKAPGILRLLTPFKYFDTAALLRGTSGFTPEFLTLSLLLIAILTAVACFFYQRRDLNL